MIDIIYKTVIKLSHLKKITNHKKKYKKPNVPSNLQIF